jgi:hypothetical protein
MSIESQNQPKTDSEENCLVELKVFCLVKGYQESTLNGVRLLEECVTLPKRGQRGKAFRVCNQRGQLGHLQIELVAPFYNSAFIARGFR